MVRMKFSAVDGKTLQYKEPARNEGYQMGHLKDVQRKEGRVKESDIEFVTKYKVIGVAGIKENPIHTVVESATPEVDWKKPDFNLTGLRGFLDVFLPPHTSLDKDQRSQQTVILVASLVQHFYPFIVDQGGECPGLMLASYEPETMKSTLSQVCAKYFSTQDNTLESGSTKESMDLKRSTSTNFMLWDDVEGGAGSKEHNVWVGGMNGLARHTVTRGKSYKLAGVMINKNLVQHESMHPKVCIYPIVNIFSVFNFFHCFPTLICYAGDRGPSHLVPNGQGRVPRRARSRGEPVGPAETQDQDDGQRPLHRPLGQAGEELHH